MRDTVPDDQVAFGKIGGSDAFSSGLGERRIPDHGTPPRPTPARRTGRSRFRHPCGRRRPDCAAISLVVTTLVMLGLSAVFCALDCPELVSESAR